jgi:hypothetical protein
MVRRAACSLLSPPTSVTLPPLSWSRLGPPANAVGLLEERKVETLRPDKDAAECTTGRILLRLVRLDSNQLVASDLRIVYACLVAPCLARAQRSEHVRGCAYVVAAGVTQNEVHAYHAQLLA